MRPRELEPIATRGAADYRKRLTASLCVLTWRDFRSRPQDLQGRSKKVDIEYVILAGSSFSPLWRACTRGLGLCTGMTCHCIGDACMLHVRGTLISVTATSA